MREILFGISVDGGLTWTSSSADRIISLPDGKAAYEEPSVAVRPYLFESESPILVVWAEDFLDNREIHYGISTDRGANFSSEIADLVLSDVSSTGEAGVPSAVIDADGVMHVVWHQTVEGGAEIHYSRSTDGGATWSGTAGDRVISFPDGNAAVDPRITEGGNGRLIVVWREVDDSGGRTLHVGISDDGGDTWSSESADRPISQPVSLMTTHDIASGDFEFNTPVYAIYAASFDTASPFHYEVYVTRSEDNGDTWTGETMTIPVSFDEDHTRSASTPDIHYSDCAGAVVVWNEEDEASGTSEQHISHSRGGDWSGAVMDEIISFPDGEDGYRPSVTGVHSGSIDLPIRAGGPPFDVWVAWTEFAGGSPDNYEVHLSANALCSGASVPEPEASALWLRASPNPAEDVVRIEYAIEAGTAAVDIFSVDGRRVRALRHDTSTIHTSGAIEWNLQGDDGARVSSGVYMVRLSTATMRHAVPVVVR